MAATVEKAGEAGDLKAIRVTGDTSYPAAGYALPRGDEGLCLPVCASGGFSAGIDPLSGNLRLFRTGNGNGLVLTEVTAGNDVSAVVIFCIQI
jgi:hypothetical protein